MNSQLLIIMVVIASSLLTLTERTSAQEISKQRWMPTTAQLCSEEATQELDVDPINDSYSSYYWFLTTPTKNSSNLLAIYNHPTRALPSKLIQPRAPPSFLI